MYFNELNKYTAFYSIFTAYILMWIDIPLFSIEGRSIIWFVF
ncbi:hypothetical protein HMPREF3212_00405 [Citrobacter freundii]|nr:putative membrane protein [Citrobacter freundii]KWZ93016.1 hypothetical protein HMPREF3212_00405 [Citrobacter freundii]